MRCSEDLPPPPGPDQVEPDPVEVEVAPPASTEGSGLAIRHVQLELYLDLPLVKLHLEVDLGPDLVPHVRLSMGEEARRKRPAGRRPPRGEKVGQTRPNEPPPDFIRPLWRAPDPRLEAELGGEQAEAMERATSGLVEPLCWVCRVHTHINGEPGFGSGFLLSIPSREHVMLATAGHVLLDGDGKWTDDVMVFPASNRSRAPHGGFRVEARHLRVSRRWREDRDPTADYGAILLPRSQVGSGLGGLAVWMAPDAAIPGIELTVAGYPVAPPPYGDPWFSRGPSPGLLEGGAAIAYPAPTAAGQSGGAVLARDQGGEWCAVGIHAVGGHHRHGIRFTPSVVAEFERWARERL